MQIVIQSIQNGSLRLVGFKRLVILEWIVLFRSIHAM